MRGRRGRVMWKLLTFRKGDYPLLRMLLRNMEQLGDSRGMRG